MEVHVHGGSGVWMSHLRRGAPEGRKPDLLGPCEKGGMKSPLLIVGGGFGILGGG